MIQYSNAVNQIFEVAQQFKLETELVSIENAVNRFSSNDVRAVENIPALSNSAMDGFALKSNWTINSNEMNPVNLKVNGTVVAGDSIAFEKISKNTDMMACEIMTGAPVPLNGYDCVVKVEDVEIEKNNLGQIEFIKLKKPLTAGENIREIGTDYRVGDLIIPKNKVIEPEDIMALASLGISKINVIRKPNVYIVSTGSELVEYTEKKLNNGQIRNSTGIYLKTLLEQMGLDVIALNHIHDDETLFEKQIDLAFNSGADIIISTGAVSMGKCDFIPNVLQKRNASIYFHKVAIRPGKPILFAKLTQDSRSVAFFGLPGNPVSSAVGVRFFIDPFLRGMYGINKENHLEARLENDFTKTFGLRTFLKSNIEFKKDMVVAKILTGQSSHIVKSLQKSNYWVIADENIENMKAGSMFPCVPLHSEFMR